MLEHSTRRGFLRASGTALALGIGTGTAAAGSGWTAVETPTGNTLHGVEDTAADAHAVGGGGVVLARSGGTWTKVLDGGPTGNGNNLYGAGVTDDGERLWFVGASGAIGEYDVVSGTLADHSAPNDVTNNFNDVAVRGPAGDANVYVAGDSGKVYYSFENGATGTWDSVTPGSGSAVNALDFHGPRSGHAVDGNQTVFATDDGATWEKIGIADANHNLYGVDSDAPDDATTSGGGGVLQSWDGAGWTPADTGDASLRDVEVGDGGGLTVGGGGAVYALGADGWVAETTPTGENLRSVVRGTPDVAVGAGGTVLER